MGSKRSWRRFSLRFLLIVVTLIGTWLAIVTNRVRTQREAVRIVQKYGGELEYDWQRQRLSGPRAPRWLRSWLGDDYFQRLEEVRLWRSQLGTATPEEVEAILRVRSLEKVLVGTPLSEQALQQLRQLPKLRELYLRRSDLTDRQLLELVGMPVRKVEVFGSRISEVGAEQFRKQMPMCELRAADPWTIDDAREFLLHFDDDGDGRLNEAERSAMPVERLGADPAGADFNSDGFVDVIEYTNWLERTPRLSGAPGY